MRFLRILLLSKHLTLKEKMDYRKEIRSIATARDVRFLLHFTKTVNLPSIVQHGLLPRQELEKPIYIAYSSDTHRLDDNSNAVSVSISRINQTMFAAKRHRSPDQDWAILILSPEILWSFTCRFFGSNAASREMRGQRGNYGAWSFAQMFGGGNNVREGLASCFPTNMDAEVQVLDVIPASFILGAVVDRTTLVEPVRQVLEVLRGEPREVITSPFSAL